jgi:hypothetical protein
LERTRKLLVGCYAVCASLQSLSMGLFLNGTNIELDRVDLPLNIIEQFCCRSLLVAFLVDPSSRLSRCSCNQVAKMSNKKKGSCQSPTHHPNFIQLTSACYN